MTGTAPGFGYSGKLTGKTQFQWSEDSMDPCLRENGLPLQDTSDDKRNAVIVYLHDMGLASVSTLQGKSDADLVAMCPHLGASLYKLDLPNTCYPADGFHYLTTQHGEEMELTSHAQAGSITWNLGTLVSQNHLYFLTMQTDCDLVRYKYFNDNGPIASHSSVDNEPGCRLVLQGNGNIVVYHRSTNEVRWAGNSHGLNMAETGPGPFKMVLTNHGDTELYNGAGEDTEEIGNSGRDSKEVGVARYTGAAYEPVRFTEIDFQHAQPARSRAHTLT